MTEPTEDSARGVFLEPGAGVTVDNPLGGPLTFKARGEETGGALTAFVSIAAPGEGPPLHLHEDQDEIWYALEGRFRLTMDGELRDAPAGTFVFIPRNVPHTWQNVGAEPGRLFVVVVPAGLERFFELYDEQQGDLSPAEAFRRIGAEVGMIVLGPRLAESDPL